MVCVLAFSYNIRLTRKEDVTEIPENKNQTWFQLINKDGTVTINNGTNGLQKLDLVLEAAHECNILVIISLTNNWNPIANSSTSRYLDIFLRSHPQ